ncbi:hypothetical protein [Methylobacterium iners]|uniref:DUF2029 domain-containing protein n=1 Tax=Methylobacterium iners TaxID=418707 RepID=A0ABQ4S1K1_9HYPH|nr:hypothetical protein [Methylobacterium iners]GJD96939.1 hypothetical protein OCOJLMKI_4167 [Methylobacterium iners]
MAALTALGAGQFETRFAGWPAVWARALLAALAVLVIYGIAVGIPPEALPAPAEAADALPNDSDLRLYRAIAGRVAAGEDYYAAAAAEQRSRGYPLKPFITVRLPTLAYLVTTLGPETALFLLRGLGLLALGILALRLRKILPTGPLWVLCLWAAAVGAAPAQLLKLVPLHEAWAALLLVLSLVLRRPGRYGLSLALGFAAFAVRELALPYLFVMAVLAWRDGERREMLAWMAAILAAAAVLGAHALMVGGVVTHSDGVSPGWTRVEGWPLILAMVGGYSLLLLLPSPLVGVLVPLCLLGWVGWRHPLAERAALTLCGYACAFMIVGRLDTAYWGVLIAPLFLTGLALAPAALRDLWQAAGLRSTSQTSSVTLSPS